MHNITTSQDRFRTYLSYQHNVGNYTTEDLSSDRRKELFEKIYPAFPYKYKSKVKYLFFFLLREDIAKTI